MAKRRAGCRARETTSPSRSTVKAALRRAAAVSEELAALGLGSYVWKKKLIRDLSRGLLPDITSFRSEHIRCVARGKDAADVRASTGSSRRRSPPPNTTSSLAMAAAEEEAKEAAFLLEKSRLGAEARLAEGRSKPIDMLVASLHGTRRRALDAFRGASVEILKELREEIMALADLDKINAPFWEAAKVTCHAELEKAAAGTAGHGERLLHPAILADVKSIVEGKSLKELAEMEGTIAARLAGGEDKVVEHWQGVTELIQIERARKYLEHNYSTRDAAPASLHSKGGESARTDGGGAATDAEEEGSEPLRAVALPPHTTPGSGWRKPRYAARARSGYDWTTYNRLHYDHDHPPPKIIRSYKFVVYYPDLAAGAGVKPPQYTVEGDGDSDETCILRFRAGWPYEDVAFRILNKEWEYSREKGFKSTFEGGVLRLEFRLKRFFYRR